MLRAWEKAEKMLAVQPKYSDDLAHRIEFFQRFFPRNYLDQNHKAREAQQALPSPPPPAASEPAPLAGNLRASRAWRKSCTNSPKTLAFSAKTCV
jgi:hypothetical protein